MSVLSKTMAVVVLLLAAIFFSYMVTHDLVEAAIGVIALAVLGAVIAAIVWAVRELSTP